jgi:hypothetical protein
MTVGTIVATVVGICLATAAIIGLANLPSTPDATTAALIALVVPFVLFGAGLTGLVWDRWLR